MSASVADSADARIRTVVAASAAALSCVNILPQVESLYLCDNKLEETTEVSMLIKTTKDCYPELEKAIKENHPYDVPEIIALDIAAGLPEYLSWINQSTTKLQ